MTPVAISAEFSLHGQSGPVEPPQLQRVRQIKADPTLVLGRRYSSLHKKNKHLPQLIESMMQSGADEGVSVSLAVQIADSMSLTLDQMREGARLLATHTAKQDIHPLAAETAGRVQTGSKLGLPTTKEHSSMLRQAFHGHCSRGTLERGHGCHVLHELTPSTVMFQPVLTCDGPVD